MNLRCLAVLVLCLAFLGTRVSGLHFHVAAAHEHAAGDIHAVHHQDHASARLTSDFASDHLDWHASHGESDVGKAKEQVAKLPAPVPPVLLVLSWLGFLFASPLSGGVRLPVRWLRPPDIPRWPALLLPPSQGPPRAI